MPHFTIMQLMIIASLLYVLDLIFLKIMNETENGIRGIYYTVLPFKVVTFWGFFILVLIIIIRGIGMLWNLGI